MWMRRFPLSHQLDAHDCGAACLQMISRYYGSYHTLQHIRDTCGITKQGVSLRALGVGAEQLGFKSLAVRCSLEDVQERLPLPMIVHWQANHFVVVYRVSSRQVWVADPLKGHVTYALKDFLAGWLEADGSSGLVLCLEPQADFARLKAGQERQASQMLDLLSYFTPYRRSLALVFGLMLVVTLIQVLLPFISKAVIDIGIKTSDTDFIQLVLIGNAVLLLSAMAFNAIRDWVLMHITARVNVALISDYLIKLMKLPISFFETKQLGDILQRAHDHERVRSFLMNHSLALIFSVLTFVLLSVILLIYDAAIFGIFIFGSALYFSWVLLFLKVRKRLDWRLFDLHAQDQSYWVETVEAMADIKVHNHEQLRRWRWEGIQARLYHINRRLQAVSNVQELGAQFIEQLKSMAITFYCAIAVIHGEITLGVMISAQFILGMLHGPLVQFINFIVSAQYARISFLRMREVRQLQDEQQLLSSGASQIVPQEEGLTLRNVHFQYTPTGPMVLTGITAHIPPNKVTAIVGGSGSGKSTLLKLLIRLYAPSYGEVQVGAMNVQAVDLRAWRDKIAVVMQDGKLFNDTIRNNITMDAEEVDPERLQAACRTAQIEQEIYAMPQGFDTVVGEQGRGLSGGQRQRLLIARALYREPRYLFLDEATNALDTVNEARLIEALKAAFEHRTVVVVAHRLSTVRHADQILVLDQGFLVEQGTHEELIKYEGIYHRLVTSQAELLE